MYIKDKPQEYANQRQVAGAFYRTKKFNYYHTESYRQELTEARRSYFRFQRLCGVLYWIRSYLLLVLLVLTFFLKLFSVFSLENIDSVLGFISHIVLFSVADLLYVAYLCYLGMSMACAVLYNKDNSIPAVHIFNIIIFIVATSLVFIGVAVWEISPAITLPSMIFLIIPGIEFLFSIFFIIAHIIERYSRDILYD